MESVYLWSEKLPAASRFKLVLNKEAVLDKETGLVWERNLSPTTLNWNAAVVRGFNLTVGGRKGWRLPTIEELASLIDPLQNAPALPSGHPFQNVAAHDYWSATTVVSNAADYSGHAWVLLLGSGNTSTDNKNADYYVWYVRGGHGEI